MTAALTCDTSTFAPGRDRCPSDCPLQAPDVKACHWRCVKNEDCAKTNSATSVADSTISMCRACQNLGCEVCAPGTDTCIRCMSGYEVIEGACLSKMRRVWTWVFSIVAGVIGFVVLYFLSLLCRQPKGKAVLNQALAYRDQASLRDSESGRWYALTSNLRSVPTDGRAPIGGPGLMMFFNFQYIVLMWIVLAALAWMILGVIRNPALFTLGTIEVENAQEMCQAVHWGKAMREQLRVVKLTFMVSLYIVSTIGVILYGAYQFRIFNRVDARTATMMDYALICKGFPPESGKTVEADVLSYFQKATRLKLVGVSVCWDYRDDRETVEQLAQNTARELEDRLVGRDNHYDEDGDGHRQEANADVSSVNVRMHFFRILTSLFECPLLGKVCCLCQPCFKAIDSVLGIGKVPPLKKFYPLRLSGFTDDSSDTGQDEGEVDKSNKQQLLELINSIKSSGSVVAVFHSEADRDAGLEALANDTAPRYLGTHVIRPSKNFLEPDSMVWDSFTAVEKHIWLRASFSVVLILFAVVVWAAFFYAPLAYYQISAYIANGEGPPAVAELCFSMIVVLGNQVMYLICGLLSENIGFNTFDNQQAAYVALYTCAVLTNTIVDLAVVVVMSYWGMTSKGVRTDDGILLSDLPDMTSLFESQPMMKVFGSMLYQYSFPACFLLPFIIESVLLCWFLPSLIERIVGTRRLSRQNAEANLKPIPMDLGRYADLLINLCLTAMCFITSSGWVLKTLAGLICGNLFIYVYDRWRVLRKTEAFYFASFSVEWLVQKMLALPCAILAAAITFTVIGFEVEIMKGRNAFAWMTLAFFAHLVLHVLAIELLVPRLGYDEEKEQTEVPYKEAAKHYPGNWFSTNPVHCLRSACIHRHSPPCVYRIKGKEFVLRKNAQLGLFYEPPARQKLGTIA
eukprot:TRINITY_DN4319_c0_g1_i5.p1 TRINITY_DN4319_c0_g1~~TRINITY_DN4319_c0_g1_i5.p1  ORF type:complete len:926 (-),score=106.43 TRINITY_DN4319_c0_g1_i5:192-2924(-)